jgi:hypothetical protein
MNAMFGMTWRQETDFAKSLPRLIGLNRPVAATLPRCRGWTASGESGSNATVPRRHRIAQVPSRGKGTQDKGNMPCRYREDRVEGLSRAP